jgi:methionyl-tRNA formyltransferase
VARLAFLGTPDLAVSALRALSVAGHDIVIVVTRPDRRRGRGPATAPSPVKAVALDLGLHVAERTDDVLASGAELGVVVAYGRIIPARVLSVVPMINVHFSLLPRWRGAAPVERAILAGDEVTGVCVMAMEEGLDTGPLYRCESVAVGDEDLPRLQTRLADIGAQLLVDLLALGPSGLPTPVPQRGTPTYAEKLRPEERELHFEEPAVQLARRVRLGRAWTTFRGGRLTVWEAQPVDAPFPAGAPQSSDTGEQPGSLVDDVVLTGEGALRLQVVQPEGRARMAANEWRRGARPEPGERLGPG